MKSISSLFPSAQPLPLVLLVTALLAPLAGCGWLTGDNGIFRDRSQDYRRAKLDPPLVLPAGTIAPALDDELAIPTGGEHKPLSGTFEVPRPAPIEGNPAAELVRIQRLGNDRWLLVKIEPGEVWPRIRQFLAGSGLAVARLDVGAGIIETDWLQPQQGGRERYRFRIEQGVQRGSSEVFVLQAGATAGEDWPVRSSDDEREAEMVRALGQYIADTGTAGVVSMVAQRGLESRGKVTLERGASPVLKLQLTGERAWASVELALPKAGFVVEDVNREQSAFWVRYAPPEEQREKKGWFSWLFGSDEALLDDSHTVYRVTVSGEADAGFVRIAIRRDDGEPLSAADTEQLLQLLKGHLT
jgi:outer membrane protein assembly factor BamC